MKKRSIILDNRKFNLMLERMDNKYTFEESIVKGKNLLLEGFPKGILGDVLSSIGKTADKIELALKNAGLKLGDIDAQNFLRGLDFFSDPKIKLPDFKNVDMASFKNVLQTLKPAEDLSFVFKKLDNISATAEAAQRQGNTISNLLQDAAGSIEEVEEVLTDTFDAYPDFLEDADIQPGYKSGDNPKVFRENTKVGDFVRNSIRTADGFYVDGVPKSVQTRINKENFLKSQDTPDMKPVEGDGGPKDGEPVYVDPETGQTYIGKVWEKTKKIWGSNWVQVPWKATGIPLWWKWLRIKELFSPLDFKWRAFGIRTLQLGYTAVAINGIPFPPGLYYLLYDCLYTYYTNPNEGKKMIDPDTGNIVDYEMSLWECLGADIKLDENGKVIQGPAGNRYLIWPVGGVVVPWLAEKILTKYLGNPIKYAIRAGEKLVQKELDNIFKIDTKDPKKSFKTLLNIKCDTETIKVLKDQFIDSISSKTGIKGEIWVKILSWVPGFEDLDKALKLDEEETDQILELFGSLEVLGEFQKRLKTEYEDWIPNNKKNKGLSIGDIVTYKCQAARISAITKVVKLLEGDDYWFPSKSEKGKNEDTMLCDNINFWIDLSTPIGSNEWSNEECTRLTEEVTEIYNTINDVTAYSEYNAENTMLDPNVWNKSCESLNNIMTDENLEVFLWICENGSKVVVDAEVEEVPIEVKVFHYKWQKHADEGDKDFLGNCQTVLDVLNNKAASEGKYLITPNEEGSGLVEDEYGVRKYDICNPNVQKVLIDDYWCVNSRITNIGKQDNKTTNSCIVEFKNYLKGKNICS